jgi:DNA mismatch endonuclease, patch repair protein
MQRLVDIPYPKPTSRASTAVMRANTRRDTKPEIRLRSLLHAAGLRYRVDHLIRCGERGVRPDIVFSRQRLAVFVDGCFWHACPKHGTSPKLNTLYWSAKLATNVSRDRRVNAALRRCGWKVIRVWEHTSPETALRRILGALEKQGKQTKQRGD